MGLKKRTKVTAEFNMSSMTDIIFLLLIFFMLTSSAVSPTAINLRLPNSSRTSTSTSTAKPIKLEINSQKEYTLNGGRIAEAEVRNQMTSVIASDGRNPEEITVILSIHESVDAQTLVTNVDMFNDLGVKMILATKIEE